MNSNSTCTEQNQYRRRAWDVESRSALRAGVSNRAHDVFHYGNARLGIRAGEWVPPSLFPSPVPGIGIRAVDAVAVVRTFHDHALLDQHTERPASEGAIGRPVGCQAALWLRAVLHGCSSNHAPMRIIASQAMQLNRPSLLPVVHREHKD